MHKTNILVNSAGKSICYLASQIWSPYFKPQYRGRNVEVRESWRISILLFEEWKRWKILWGCRKPINLEVEGLLLASERNKYNNDDKAWSHEWIESSPCGGKSLLSPLLWLARGRGRGWELGQFGRKTYKWMSQAQDMKTFVTSIHKNIQLYQRHRKNCESCQSQFTWKVKFKCQDDKQDRQDK